MCRNIKPLFNFDPPASSEQIKAASLQFVKKVSGFNTPSKINEKAFNLAIKEISLIITQMFNGMTTKSKPKNREVEAEKLRKKNEIRFGKKN